MLVYNTSENNFILGGGWEAVAKPAPKRIPAEPAPASENKLFSNYSRRVDVPARRERALLNRDVALVWPDMALNLRAGSGLC